jgi:hypothetical protein
LAPLGAGTDGEAENCCKDKSKKFLLAKHSIPPFLVSVLWLTEFIQCQHKYRREQGQVMSLARKISGFSKKEHKAKKKDLVLSIPLLTVNTVAKSL